MKKIPVLIISILILLLLILLAVSLGAVKISPSVVVGAVINIFKPGAFEVSSMSELIIFRLRLPRVLLAAIAGAGLGISGAVFQGVFRNPLAEPYLLGVSSGAALGATIAIVFTFDMIKGIGMGIGGLTSAAFLGAVATTLLIFFFAGGIKRDFSFLLLGGIAMSYIFQAVISFLMMMNRNELDRIVFWMMGSFSAANWTKVAVSGGFVALSSLFLFFNSRKLNILSLGNQEAYSLGLNPGRTGILLLLVSSLITAAVISVSGIIGFVGLLVPHIVRLFTGPDHRKVLPFSALGGAVLLIYADLASRILIPPKEIPVGVITAILGGPFFLILLKVKSREKSQ